MLLRALQVLQFRNLAETTLAPSPGFNVFAGDNGQGKTNLLEAVYLAGTLRSFRTAHAAEMIRFGEQQAAVRARVERGGLERLYEVQLTPRRRQARLDGKVPRVLAEYFGDFNVVLFAPEDLRVPRGSPAGRRRFLDRSVFNRHVAFLEDAQRYARLLKSRNVLLREGRADGDLLASYDEGLASVGDRVVESRRRYLEELRPLFSQAYDSITQSGLATDLVYVQEWAGPLAAALEGAHKRDRARGQTTVGPHVDDVEFRLDGRPARAFASQGQLRALVLAWKTAEMQLLRDRLGDAPVLLLDDVSSELDPSRNAYLFAFLQRIECQCFVTTTHPKHVPLAENRKDFQVVAGRIEG